jgi:hypothetical protein
MSEGVASTTAIMWTHEQHASAASEVADLTQNEYTWRTRVGQGYLCWCPLKGVPALPHIHYPADTVGIRCVYCGEPFAVHPVPCDHTDGEPHRVAPGKVERDGQS